MLDKLYFGKDDAETDLSRGGLLSESFVQTQAYEAAINGTKSLIIGRKGCGKSAIGLMLLREFDKTSRATLISPDEISADEVRRFSLPGIPSEQSKRLIWRYIFSVQIAKFIIRVGDTREKNNEETKNTVAKLRQFLVENNEIDELSVIEKFWRVVEKVKGKISLSALGVEAKFESGEQSTGILADEQLEQLEDCISEVAKLVGISSDSEPFFLLIDQIELIWSNDRDSDAMVVALLEAQKHVKKTFSFINCVVFLRTDIYEALDFRERDKFRGEEHHIHWSEKHLLELVEKRARISTKQKLTKKQLWREIFPSKMGDTKITDYLVSRTLMRPRDAIQLCNACRDIAHSSLQNSIRTQDILTATIQYSSWKLSDLQSEWIVNFPFIADFNLLVTNVNFILNRDLLSKRFKTIYQDLMLRYPAVAASFNVDYCLDVLLQVGIIGVVRQDTNVFGCKEKTPIKVDASDSIFVIHPCFREALQSNRAIGLGAFEASEQADVFTNSYQVESLRGLYATSRGTRSFRYTKYIIEGIKRAKEFVRVERKLTHEAKDELLIDLDKIEKELEGSFLSGDIVNVSASSRKILTYFRKLDQCLDNDSLIGGKSDIRYVIRDVTEELENFERSGSIDEYFA